MTEPTDAELDMLIDDVAGLDSSNEAFRNFARAVLAKWGAPPAVAWKHDCSALLTNDVELWINACPHCGKPRTPTQPTQAQAGAVPLTDEQIEALPLWKRFVGLWPETRREIVRTIEYHHGIKGGQQ